jgi:hypothetical protein
MPISAITIIIIPAGRRSGAFEAFLHGRLLCRSTAPLLASARVLLHRGHHPATVLQMVHGSTPDVIGLSATIGCAAARPHTQSIFKGGSSATTH